MNLATSVLRRGFLIACLAWAAVFSQSFAEEPARPKTVKEDWQLRSEMLVERLGDASFAARQDASRQLEELGVAAKAALLQGLKSDDAEVRARCRRILSVVLDQDLQARLSAFDRGQAVAESPLPGWARFQKEVGDDPASRALFVEMVRAEPHLFEASEGDARTLGPLLQQRCDQMQQRAFESNSRNRRPIDIGSVAALFFIGSQDEVPVTDTFVSYLHTFSYQPTFRGAMSQSEKAPVLRKILGLWITRPAGTVNSYQNFMLSLQFGLREGLEPAVTMLRDGGAQPHMAQYAMLLVGRFGEREGAELLLPFLTDQNLLGSYSVNDKEVRTELRDVALAVLVHMTGQDHELYGFDHLQKSPDLLFQPVTAGFTSPREREEAFERWERWALANLKAETVPLAD